MGLACSSVSLRGASAATGSADTEAGAAGKKLSLPSRPCLGVVGVSPADWRVGGGKQGA